MAGVLLGLENHFSKVETDRPDGPRRCHELGRDAQIGQDEAAWRFISLDEACHVQLLASAAGEPQRWPDEMAGGLKRALGSPEFARLSFQTLWDELLAEGTDFLD